MTTHFGAFNHANIGDRLYAELLPSLTGRQFNIAGLNAASLPSGGDIAGIDDCQGPVMVGGGDILASTVAYQGFMKLPSWPMSLTDGFRLNRPAVYISVGVPFPTVSHHQGWTWVRDYQSAMNLPRRPEVVAPDLAVLTNEVFPRCADIDPVAIVQTAYPDGGTETTIRRLQESYRVRVISLTHYNGDGPAMAGIAKRCGITMEIIATPAEMVEAISSAALVIASSMHANIVAFSYGIPHLMAPTPEMTKMPGFLDVVGLPRHLRLGSWSQYSPDRQLVDDSLLARAQRLTRSALDCAIEQLSLLQ